MARSISVRLTLSLAVISASMFLLVGTGIYVGLSITFERAARDELLGKMRVVRHFVDEAARNGDLEGLHYRMDDMLIGHDELRVWLLRADGQPLGYVHNLSKRTAVYTTYARVKNSGGASVSLGGAVTAVNNSSSGFDFGVRHSF